MSAVLINSIHLKCNNVIRHKYNVLYAHIALLNSMRTECLISLQILISLQTKFMKLFFSVFYVGFLK